MKKRILSILLLCCMVLTLLPTAAFAAGEIDEQFTLAPGGTYYFDLSAMGIPGTVNDALPDKTMRYVPFTYAGTVDSYKLTSEMATTEEYAQQSKYAHGLFIADFAVTHEVSWDNLNAKGLIFGKNYTAGGVSYTLRAPSVGSDSAGSGDSQHGTPQSNEWDRILDKNDGYIKNWSRMHSWGQDISRSSWTTRAFRGYISARYWTASWSESSRPSVGFRPVLEILNPGTLGSDGLKAVTLDLGGGKLGNSFKDIQIIVKKGSEFTAPASDGLTRPDGNADSYFQWLGSDGKLYAPGDSVPADVIKLTAQFDFKEQFTLAPGGVYYFDLSGVSIPGTANGSLPDKTMHYVPFTYAGTVVAYKLTSEMATTEEYAQQNEYAHSLFVADYAVTHAVSWDNLNAEGLIFGKGYATGSVDYTLRAPSGGSGGTGSGALERGTPQSNEWDRILDKDDGYIKNWRNIGSWGQDTLPNTLSNRVIRGQDDLPRTYAGANTTLSFPFLGFRPVLEVLNPGTLGSDGLKAVTLDLGGGKLGGSSDTIQIIVKTGESFTAPASEGLTRPDGNTGSSFKWLGSDGNLYAPGESVPADVIKLTAQFAPTITTDTLPDGKVGEAYSHILTADGTTPITWSVDGGLPASLSLNKDTGEISGTPTAEGTSTFTVKAENSTGSVTKELSITIAKAAPPSHEHNYGDWSKDGTNHWHECTDDDCPNREESIKDKAAHVYDDDADTTCDACGYERTITPPAHEHRYGDWRKDGTSHWHECTDADCPNREESIKDKTAHVYDNDADTTCNTCGYERTVAPPAPTEFTVIFDGNGGTPSVGSMTTTNRKLTSLPSASRSGSYSFDGWYTEKSGGTKITTATVFSAKTTVYAHWTYTGGGGGGYNPPVTYYTLRFETGGGSDIPSVREAYNTYIDLTKYVPTWRGHTFIGWYTERSLINKVSGVYLTKDMTVYALWRVDENPGTGANPFTDVSEKDWFYGDVMFVYENGLMLGTSKTLFSPHGTATRGMMATILWRMEGSPAPKGKNSFTDVEAGKWYADAITWTAENGIFAGYGKDKFGPDDPITREQLAAIFYRYADYKGYDLTVKGNLDKFKDADKITDYAKTAMQWAVGSGLVKGKSGNLLDPQGTATRAEIAAMLHRFIEKYELVQGKAPGGLMGWIDPKRLQIPKTGDSSVLGLWGISLCTSLAGCLALTTWQIRRRREEESLQIIEK